MSIETTAVKMLASQNDVLRRSIAAWAITI